jgi:hypothetical protein
MGVRVCVGACACAYMHARCTSACLPGLPALPSMDMWGGAGGGHMHAREEFQVGDTMHGMSLACVHFWSAYGHPHCGGGGGDAHEREQAQNQINETWDGASM